MSTDSSPATTIRTAILPVADCFNERHVRRMLPPEHRIIATRPDSARGITDYMIEGLELPPVDILSPIFTMQAVEGAGVQLSGQWLRDGPPWIIGVWPSMEDYLREMDTLNAGS